MNGVDTLGEWTPIEQDLHINVQELALLCRGDPKDSVVINGQCISSGVPPQGRWYQVPSTDGRDFQTSGYWTDGESHLKSAGTWLGDRMCTLIQQQVLPVQVGLLQ